MIDASQHHTGSIPLGYLRDEAEWGLPSKEWMERVVCSVVVQKRRERLSERVEVKLR